MKPTPDESLAKIALLSVFVAFIVAGCTHTDFLRYEGRSDVYFEGAGGARTVVDGIDFWEHGDPPRRYQLLGYIHDDRSRGLIPQLQKRGDIAAKAREAGGTAVMLLSSGQTINGFVGSGFGNATATSYGNRTTATATGTSISVPVGRTDAQYAVIKYLD